jgi:hypothetical protein
MSIEEFKRRCEQAHTVGELTGLFNAEWGRLEGTRAEHDEVFGVWCARREQLSCPAEGARGAGGVSTTDEHG